MRFHCPSPIAALLVSLVLPPALLGQSAVPDYLVRVTLRDSSGGHRLVGHVTPLPPDSLALRLVDSDSVVRIDRSSVLRIERRVDVSVGKAMLAGCLAVGGILALAGSQVHDPTLQELKRSGPSWAVFSGACWAQREDSLSARLGSAIAGKNSLSVIQSDLGFRRLTNVAAVKKFSDAATPR